MVIFRHLVFDAKLTIINRMKIRRLLTLFSIFLLFVYANAYAYTYAPAKKNIGDLAEGVVGVELVVHSFIRFLFVTAGIGLIFASLYHFKLWSQNRIHRPFSRPLFFLIFGIALIGLVYIPMFVPK